MEIDDEDIRIDNGDIDCEEMLKKMMLNLAMTHPTVNSSQKMNDRV